MSPSTRESTEPRVGSLPLAEDFDVEPTGRHLGGDTATEVLAAIGITKTYTRGLWPRRRRLDVLRGAGLRLRSGEIVGLVGENGSGKSTLMQILVGGIERDGGTVSKSGSVGYCPQEPILYERLTCDEHFQLFGRAYGMNEVDVDSARDHIYRTLGLPIGVTRGSRNCREGPEPN
jgi:ABC-type multidrug transport system ATPase subunit